MIFAAIKGFIISQTAIMKKDRLTPRADRKKTNRSVSPQNVTSKGKAKIFFPTSRNLGKENQ